MHLLNTSTLRLESFDYNIPSYAILSHTWGKTDDEVTYQDITHGGTEYKTKPGYNKIEFCARTAADRGLQYCWVDSCCINKLSSAELSEAINSMYAWYEKSVECYVYLADVDAQTNDLESEVLKSRWFDRGWTLQELIAPRSLLFFDKKGSCFGKVKHRSPQSPYRSRGFSFNTKTPGIVETQGLLEPSWLATTIRKKTGITRETLITGSCRECSVGMKMSWASTRQTSREEDMAYCLMGIFGINMPLIYGEGDKAFLRLQEEILKKNTDHTLFAWYGRTGFSFNGLLSPSPKHFQWLRNRESFHHGSQQKLIHVPGNIVSHQSSIESYQMTNNGLRIRLRLCYCYKDINLPNEYETTVGADENCVYFIKLRQLNDNGQFARVDVNQYVASTHGHSVRPVCAESPKPCPSEWIHVRQSFEDLRISPCLDRVSMVTLHNSSSPMLDVDLECVTGLDKIEPGRTVFPLVPGQDFETMLRLKFKTRDNSEETEIVWLIQAEGKANNQDGVKNIVSRFSYPKCPILGDSASDWRDSCVVGKFSTISSQIDSEILSGELAAKVTLKVEQGPL